MNSFEEKMTPTQIAKAQKLERMYPKHIPQEE